MLLIVGNSNLIDIICNATYAFVVKIIHIVHYYTFRAKFFLILKIGIFDVRA